MYTPLPFAAAAKPDTFDLTKTKGVFAFYSSAETEGKLIVYPKDYVPQPKQKVYVTSPFTRHQAPAKGFKEIERTSGQGWVFLALLGIFLLLLWLKRINPKKLWIYLSAIYNRRALNEIFDEENILSSPYSLILFIAFCLSGSLFITKTAGLANYGILEQFGPLQALGIFAGILLVAYTLKILSIQVVGSIFNLYPIARQYAFNVYLLNNILGLLLIPLVAIAYYSGYPADIWSVYVGVGLFILFFVLRFAKALSIDGVMTPLNLVYLFLYLCTLEILPLVVAIKIVKDYL